MQTLKIATYNVNGIGARLPNLLQWLERERPDVVCLQELKAPDKAFPARELEAAGYGTLHLGQPSWNGVAILARDAQPLLIQKGLPGEENDTQARYLQAAAHGVIVACLYLPNGNPRPGPKFDYKLRWFEHLIEHAKSLQASDHPVVLAGDFNVVPTDEDIYSPRSWLKDALLQPESRDCYKRLLGQGWVDSLRHLYPEERIYTYWDYFRQHWEKNSGLRIDHLLLNPKLAPHLEDAGVDAWVRGEAHASDHAPTWIRVSDPQKKAKGKTATSQSVKKDPSAKKPPAKIPLSAALKAALPESIKPELATLVESAPEGDWRYEIKFDGYRVMARVDAGQVQLFTRNGHDWTHKLPRQAEAIAALGLDNAWLDGEMVVANEDGVPDFQALQNAFETERSGNIIYYLFDLPFLNGADLREVPIEQRRAALSKVLEPNTEEVLRFSEDFAETPDALLNSACQMNMEGLIGKRVGSPYVSRRSDDWIKLKCKRRQEFVVVGYSDPKGARSKFGALLLGLHNAESGELRYAGKVGTGFNEITLNSIYDQLLPLEAKQAAVVNPPTGFEAKGVHWLKPELLAEVAFADITKEGSVRHAVFQGLRNDKPATSITEERPAPPPEEPPSAKRSRPTVPKTSSKDKKTGAAATRGKIRLTHPERVIDPTSSSTKRDLADYYISVSDWLLPQLANRPVALVRAPEGIGGELFFQKNADRLAIPGIETMGKEYTGHPVMLINNIEALIGAVQMSAMELHTWNAVSRDLQRPDRFVLDLDPDPALPWKSMVEAAQLTLAVLDELGLTTFLKTSGGKGVHLVVPLTPKADWDAVKDFSHAIVKHIAKLLPDRFSAVSGPKNRVGRIFIDYLRNGLGATTICAYSVRTREGLPVSVPIFREELDELKGANVWNIHNIHERLGKLKSDPWADLPETRQTITADMRRRVGL
ncbi:DNA ligase D [Pseudomonas sp. LP_7_YM]|uniref:DNA ligase D n=1 Tax=Pseudomonas sp. LP_7_YM TaxID=2485137 RepID=UPI00105D94F5|nr:DNA ligase D [Pseudomonas sp. LP_7_YM]TDV72518.1 bifunctional non-homologous end joining protein LigD [Pseudomonas sp. LP_7_YM]